MDDRMPPATVPAALPAYPPRIRVLARPGRKTDGAEILSFLWWLDDAAPGDLLILTDGVREWAVMIEYADAHLLHTAGGLTFHRVNGALVMH